MSEEISVPVYMWKEKQVVIDLLTRERDALGERCKELIRERDEARAEVERLKQSEILGREVLLPVTREQAHRLTQVAEAHGYRRGVEDARNAMRYSSAGMTVEQHAAILALLEKEKQSDRD